MTGVIRSARPSATVRAGFAWLTGRMFRRSFQCIRVTPAGAQRLQDAARYPGPLMIVGNHSSWWDPLVALHLAGAPLDRRPLCAPIEMRQYERFGILRRLGLFGIDQHHPEALSAMVAHVADRAADQPRLLVCITPQGRFTDVRTPVRLRPGAAALASSLEELRVLTCGIEYGFWQDKRPEVFLHFEICEIENARQPSGPVAHTADWQRRLTRGLQATLDELADGVKSRDPARFVPLAGGPARFRGPAVNPAYDLWLRLRGVGSRIEPAAGGSATSADRRGVPAGRGGRWATGGRR